MIEEITKTLTMNPWLIFLLMAWSLAWKGVALWKAARNEHKWWFIPLLIINTVGILEIIYIFLFSEKKQFIKEEKEEE